MRTSLSSLCTCIRAPSSLYSNAALPKASSAAAVLSAVCASIGCKGCMSSSRKASSPSCPSVIAAAATDAEFPDSITARRTSRSGSPEAFAMASTITPSSAPCRSSPSSRRARKSCSTVVARPKSSVSSLLRSRLDPLPDIVAICSNAESTSRTARVETSLAPAPRACRTIDGPSPMRPWRKAPMRYSTPVSTSSGANWRRQPWSKSIFLSRLRVAATASEVSASILKSMSRVYTAGSMRDSERFVLPRLLDDVRLAQEVLLEQVQLRAFRCFDLGKRAFETGERSSGDTVPLDPLAARLAVATLETEGGLLQGNALASAKGTAFAVETHVGRRFFPQAQEDRCQRSPESSCPHRVSYRQDHFKPFTASGHAGIFFRRRKRSRLQHVDHVAVFVDEAKFVEYVFVEPQVVEAKAM